MTIQGKSVYSGVAIGRLAIYQKSENQVKREKITDTAKEIKRFVGVSKRHRIRHTSTEDSADTAEVILLGDRKSVV